MLKKTLLVLAGLLAVAIVGVLVAASTKPDDFRIQRSASITAPPEKIFPLINDFRAFGSWSPYEKLDPAMKRSYTGAAAGKGAVYAWEGDGQAGAGRMEITESASPSRIALNLDFTKPFEAHNIVEFTLEPRGGATIVTWAMHGPTPFLAKVMHVFINFDRMVGADFETGLANLKTLAER